jgi:hypothetical protein
MTIFFIGLAVGLITAVVYVTVAIREFLRVRHQVLHGGERAEVESSTVYEGQGRHFGWKTAGGVVASILLLVLVSLSGLTWYLLPILAIGSSVAVIVAFLIDRHA